MAFQERQPPVYGRADAELSAAELTILWQLALRLSQCDSVDAARGAVADATGSNRSPAFQRAVAETQAAAVAAVDDRERLLALASCDPLTGLANRRCLEDELERWMNMPVKATQPLALAMLDLDYFRDYNDGYGHLAGDLVLQSLAVLLRGFCCGNDRPCRYGGDEFMLIMPTTTAGQAGIRLDPFRRRLAETGMFHEGRLLRPVTASIGVAEFPRDGQSVAAIIHAADTALYRAKRAGRNCICCIAAEASVTSSRWQVSDG